MSRIRQTLRPCSLFPNRTAPDEKPQFEWHIEAGKLVFAIKLGSRNVLSTKPAGPNDRDYFFDPNLPPSSTSSAQRGTKPIAAMPIGKLRLNLTTRRGLPRAVLLERLASHLDAVMLAGMNDDGLLAIYCEAMVAASSMFRQAAASPETA